MDGKKQNGKSHKKVNPNFPLRGFVMCSKCDKPLSASTSKGRNKPYSYYHCFSPCDVLRTADINSILHKIAHFNRVNRKNKKRDKSKKEDLSRCVHNVLQLSNLFFKDLDRLREFSETYKKYKLLSL